MLGFFTYLAIGAIVLKFHFGMTGRDIIPNRDFWNELPYLTKVSPGVSVGPLRKPQREDTEFLSFNLEVPLNSRNSTDGYKSMTL